MNTSGHLLALSVTPANVQDRAQVAESASVVQEATGDSVEIDQDQVGEAAADAAGHEIRIEMALPPWTKRGSALLPRRWVVDRSLPWGARFRRLARDDERLPKTVPGLHFLAFTCLVLQRLINVVAQGP